MSTLQLKTLQLFKQDQRRELHEYICHSLTSTVLDCYYCIPVETAIPNFASQLCHRESDSKRGRHWRVHGIASKWVCNIPSKNNNKTKTKQNKKTKQKRKRRLYQRKMTFHFYHQIYFLLSFKIHLFLFYVCLPPCLCAPYTCSAY